MLIFNFIRKQMPIVGGHCRERGVVATLLLGVPLYFGGALSISPRIRVTRLRDFLVPILFIKNVVDMCQPKSH